MHNFYCTHLSRLDGDWTNLLVFFSAACAGAQSKKQVREIPSWRDSSAYEIVYLHIIYLYTYLYVFIHMYIYIYMCILYEPYMYMIYRCIFYVYIYICMYNHVYYIYIICICICGLMFRVPTIPNGMGPQEELPWFLDHFWLPASDLLGTCHLLYTMVVCICIYTEANVHSVHSLCIKIYICIRTVVHMQILY